MKNKTHKLKIKYPTIDEITKDVNILINERKERLENGDRMINNEIESILEERHEPLDEDDPGINLIGDPKV